MGSINTVSISRKARAALDKGTKVNEIKSLLKDKAFVAAQRITKDLQAEFNEHVVTQELKNPGNNQSDIPGFPKSSLGVYGNLASFLGLPPSKVSRELEVMRALFSSFTINVIRKQTGQFEVNISYPPLKTFYGVTPPPEGAYPISWLQGIEKAAIQNFSQFIFKKKGSSSSRSGKGFQVDDRITLRKTPSMMPEIPYIKDIYQRILEDTGRAKSTLGKIIKSKF